MWAGAAMALSSCSVVLSSLFLTRFKCLSVNEIEKKKICNNYMNIIQKHYGRAWSYDLRQVELAGDVLRAGYTIDSFNSDANGLVEWSKRNNKQPPQSLQYFVARRTNSQKPKEAIDIVKQMAGKMKL